MFNRWRKFPREKPTKKGWYQCTVDAITIRYVMDLYWTGSKWLDNRRIEIFHLYDVYAYGDFGKNKKIDWMYENSCDRTDDVVYWKKLPKPNMKGFISENDPRCNPSFSSM